MEQYISWPTSHKPRVLGAAGFVIKDTDSLII